MKKIYTLLLVSVFVIQANVSGQYVTKKVRSVHEAYTDSLKNVQYDYIFPILGQGAYKQGFDIPYPAGIMANYIWMDQGLDMTNMQLGFDGTNTDIPLSPTDFIEFGDNRNTSYIYNVRPDLWILPFLNVYGLFGGGKSVTEVNLIAPIELKSVVEQNVRTAGLGVMTAFGVGPVWVNVDVNWTWTKPELLDKPVKVGVLGLRIGHTFTFKKRPYSNIAIWAGAMSLKMGEETVGQIALIDALPQETWDRRDEIVNQYNAWYDGLSPAKQAIVDNTAFPEIIDRIGAADGSAVIGYAMDKKTSEMWNGIVGAQYQFNKKWQLRTEWGIIGDRKSMLFSLNYRFLL